jgi:hypothetical protein
MLHPEEIDSRLWLTPAELSRQIAVRPADYCSALKLIWSIAERRPGSIK